jgi:hypothetical protein
MVLIIDAILSKHPSEIMCFRDVTLYAKTYVFEDIVIECPVNTRSFYWDHLKKHGAHDFVSQLITVGEYIKGYRISQERGNCVVESITCENLQYIISRLQQYKHFFIS